MASCLLFYLLTNVACTDDNSILNKSSKISGFSEVSQDKSGLLFTNKVIETEELNVNNFSYMYNGSGVGIGDLNNDGLDEVFLGGNDTPSKLFLNKGELVFEDITTKANIIANEWTNGVSFVDVNNDGWLDIYICNAGPPRENANFVNQLFINNRDLTFTESAAKFGLDIDSQSMQAFFADMDNDGDLDLFLNNHLNRSLEKDPILFIKKLETDFSISELARVSNMYYENQDGKYINKSVEKNVANAAFGLGSAITDLDKDGWLDIYTTNDFFLPDFYLRNNGKGSFEHVSDKLLSHMSFFAKGIDANDFNNDGYNDIAILEMTPADHVRNEKMTRSMNVGLFNTLHQNLQFPKQFMYNSFYLNSGDGYLTDVAHYLEVAKTDWSWAPLLFDIDNDGWKDYFISNGYLRDYMDNDYELAKKDKEEALGRKLNKKEWFEHLKEMPSTPIKNMVFKNHNGKQLSEETERWGIKTPSFSNGAAYGDLDLDGDLDLIINNLESSVSLLENKSQSNSYISIKLNSRSNPNSVYNAKVSIHIDSLSQFQEYSFTRGYNSSMGHSLHFGIGGSEKIDSIVIKYLDGTFQSIINPSINKHHTFEKANTRTGKEEPKNTNRLLIDLTPRVGGFKFSHFEDDFNDFEKEILLPHKYSNLGPCLAISDVNKDGLEDFYLGGSGGYPGILALQRGTKFEAITMSAFKNDAIFEDIGAHFFDANNDGYPDLYVASGGGSDVSTNELLQDRLYINQQDGTFKRAHNTLPIIASSTSNIISDDFNGDSLIDLFIAGRNKPNQYPFSAESYLLIQESNGRFKDETSKYFRENNLPGMITDIAYEDINNDGLKDLVFSSEWDAPSIYLRNKSTFEKQGKTGFEDLIGWWQSVLAHDFDKDGDVDLIFGNIGENNKFHPSEKKPIGLYAGDLDQNGTHDIVLTKHYKKKVVPVRGKECSTEQLPYLKDKFKYYGDFASSSIYEILEAEYVNHVDSFSVNNFSSFIALNHGKGSFFSIHKLPFEAQLAPICSMVASDFNKDGFTDVFCAGNIKETEPGTTSYDGNSGIMILGQGNGLFESSLDADFSGARCNGNVTDMKVIRLGKSQYGIIVANNNSAAQILLPLK